MELFYLEGNVINRTPYFVTVTTGTGTMNKVLYKVSFTFRRVHFGIDFCLYPWYQPQKAEVQYL